MPATTSWMIDGAVQDGQSTDAAWNIVGRRLIDGVQVRDVRNVLKGNGMITEVFRRDWFESEVEIDQVFQAMLEPGSVSAWHAHAHTTDRLFVTQGRMRIVLYDARADSPTDGLVNDIVTGLSRPALIVVPPRVWHGVQNLSNHPSTLLNLPDRGYQYGSPDHWRLPADTDRIPYAFEWGAANGGGRHGTDEV